MRLSNAWQFGVVIDSNCKDLCRLRGYSYNTYDYFNHQATPFTGLLTPEPVVNNPRLYTGESESSAPLERCLKLVVDAIEGDRHQQLLKAARLAGGFVAGGCLNEEEVIEALEAVVQHWPMFSKSQRTIRDGLRYGLQEPI